MFIFSVLQFGLIVIIKPRNMQYNADAWIHCEIAKDRLESQAKLFLTMKQLDDKCDFTTNKAERFFLRIRMICLILMNKFDKLFQGVNHIWKMPFLTNATPNRAPLKIKKLT